MLFRGRRHFRGLDLLVVSVILDDVEGVDPDITQAQHPDYLDGILEYR